MKRVNININVTLVGGLLATACDDLFHLKMDYGLKFYGTLRVLIFRIINWETSLNKESLNKVEIYIIYVN